MALPKKAISILHEWFINLRWGEYYELEWWEIKTIKEGLLGWELDSKVATNKLDIILFQLEECYKKGKEANHINIEWIKDLLIKLLERFIKFYEWRWSNAQGTLVYKDYWTDFTNSKTSDIQERSNRERVIRYSNRIKFYKTIRDKYTND